MGEEKYARPAVSRDGGVGKWLIGKWLTSTSTTARRQPLFRWLKTTHRIWERAQKEMNRECGKSSGGKRL